MALCIKVYKLYNKSDDDARIQFQKEEEEEDKEEEETKRKKKIKGSPSSRVSFFFLNFSLNESITP
jgi:hypothetical protein